MWGNKTIDRPAFLIGLLWRIVLLAALTIGLPALIFQIGSANDCGASCQSTGMLLIVAMFGLGPLGLLIFLITLPSLLVPRFRTIGISPWWTLFVFLLLLANYKLLAYASMLLVSALSSGRGGTFLERPDYLLETIAIFAVMTILPSRNGRVSLRELGWPAIAALILAVIVGFGAAIRALNALPGGLSIFSLRMGLRLLAWPALIALVALPPVALFALWPRQGQAIQTSPPPTPANPLPLLQLGLAAAGLTFVAIIVGMPEVGLGAIFMLPIAAVPIGLPTFAAYCTLVLAIYLLAFRRGPAAYVALLLTIVIFGSWAWGFVAERQARVADEAAIAAIEVAPRPAEIPDTIVLADEAINVSRNGFFLRSDIARVIATDSFGRLTQYTRSVKGTRPEQTTISSLPERYLIFRAGHSSPYAADRTRYQYWTPWELHLVAPGTDELLGVWYWREILLPRLVPVLNLNVGWMTQTLVADGPLERDLLAGFLDKTLGPAPPE